MLCATYAHRPKFRLEDVSTTLCRYLEVKAYQPSAWLDRKLHKDENAQPFEEGVAVTLFSEDGSVVHPVLVEGGVP